MHIRTDKQDDLEYIIYQLEIVWGRYKTWYLADMFQDGWTTRNADYMIYLVLCLFRDSEQSGSKAEERSTVC